MSARSSRVLAGVFLVGAVVGAILGWMGRARVDEARRGDGPEPTASTGVDGGGPGAGQGPGGVPGASRTPTPEPMSGEAPPILSAGAGGGSSRTGGERLATGTATLIVTLRGATPEVAHSATVYVLPAGAPGVMNEGEVLRGGVGEPIPVPAPAAYDVGVLFDVGRAEFTLVRDVRAEAGATCAVEASADPTPARSIHMRAAPGTLPHVPAGSVIAVFWQRTGIPTQAFPGRGEALSGRPQVKAVFDASGEGDTPPLADDGPWVATAGFDPADPGAVVPLEVDVVPRVARPGSTVEIRVEAVALVRAHAARPDGGWPDGTGPLHLAWEGAGRPASCDVRDLEELALGVGLIVSPGRGRLAWSGPGIQAGISDVAEARAELGAATKVELPLTLHPVTVRPPSRLRVHVPVETPSSDVDDSFWIATTRTGSAAPESPEVFFGGFTEDAEFEMEPPPSRDALTLVVGRGARASEVVTARGAGDLEVALHPAGWLVVLPTAPGTTAPATLERVDGGPIPFSGDAYEGRPTAAATRVPSVAGRVLGPFPAGSLSLRLRSGGIAVAEITATVRAGAFEPLRLPR